MHLYLSVSTPCVSTSPSPLPPGRTVPQCRHYSRPCFPDALFVSHSHTAFPCGLPDLDHHHQATEATTGRGRGHGRSHVRFGRPVQPPPMRMRLATPPPLILSACVFFKKRSARGCGCAGDGVLAAARRVEAPLQGQAQAAMRRQTTQRVKLTAS